MTAIDQELTVGGMCGRGHVINTERDLIVRQRRRNRCRRCVYDARNEAAAVRKSSGYGDDSSALVDRGMCSAGHEIRSAEQDTIFYDGQRRCRACVRIAKRESDLVRSRSSHEPMIVDEVVVERAINGWQGPMNALEFQAAVDVLVSRGFTNAQIATRLHAAMRTIERHVHR